jgi:transcription antitermination factor NusG
MNKTTHPLSNVCWYAVLTRSRQEKVAASMLDALDIPNFLPLINERRQWSDRKQVVSVPLFPGYVFVRISKLCESQLRVLKVPGIVFIIGNHNGPQAIPDAEIDSIRTALSHRVQRTPYGSVHIGDRIRIVRGVLAGVEGTLVRSGSGANLIISVEAIQQSIAVHIDSLDVELAFCAPFSPMSSRYPMPLPSADAGR